MTLTSLPPVTVVALPLTVNLDIYQGDDFRLDLTLSDSAGNPLDLTGWTASSVVRSAPGAKIVATFTCTISGSTVSLWLPHTESVNLARRGTWDCQIANLAGDINTIAAGTVTTSLEVTTA